MAWPWVPLRFPLSDIGAPVSLTFVDGETVDGWLYGDMPQGILISLDQQGKVVRLVKNVVRKHFLDTPRATFAPADIQEIDQKIREIDSKVRRRLERSLRILNYSPLQRFAERAPKLEARLNYFYYDEELAKLPLQYLMARFLEVIREDDSIEIHIDVFNSLEDSGITEITFEFGPEISSLPSKYVIPSIDSNLVDEEKIEHDLQIARKRPWSRQRHRRLLKTAVRTREKISMEVSFRLEHGEEEPRMEEPRRGDIMMRYLEASVRLLAGTGLVVGNAGIGLTAGLASATVTIGLTTAPIYVTIIGSIYNGLIHACDGCVKFRDIRKDIRAIRGRR